MTPPLQYIDVAVSLPVHDTYTYEVPEDLSALACTGKRVLVPFGRKTVTGYIMGVDKSESVDPKQIKPIIDIIDEFPLFPPRMIPFFRWIAAYYMHPVGEVVKGALPAGINAHELVMVEISEKGQRAVSAEKTTVQETEVLNTLHAGGPCRLTTLLKALDHAVPAALIHRAERNGWITRKREMKGAGTKPRTERYVSLCQSIPSIDALSKQRKAMVDALSTNGEISLADLKKIVPSASRLIKSMESGGLVRIFHRQVYRDPFGDVIPPDTPPPLSDEQQAAVSTVLDALGKGFSTHLLAGVTGSGKTEVYMCLATAVLQSGGSVIVLVPEIALISQMERRFRARFGECVAILHSGLSPGERYDQWLRILRKEATIAIGTRSAIFAPLSDPGLIVVDEEHDSSYKQENKLRYNARDLAVVRAKLHKSVALLGSATPSIQSYHNVKKGNFVELVLKRRVEKRRLPSISVVDLSKNRQVRGIRRFLSTELIAGIKEALSREEQILIFLNRRGYASFPICSDCGEPIRCKNCDISLTLHQEINAYKCHYCGFTKASVSTCAACGSSKIQLLGLGTERVEAAIRSLFPDARVVRMDRDTTRRKGSLLKILKGLRDQTIDILVGTQMVAKGHDFPKITLVGIICADMSLNFPDFRAGERTFQLIAQVSGRAGRGDIPGRVILQTYTPNHFSIASARRQDFAAFFEEEIQYRNALGYPPFTRMVLLRISGRDRIHTEAAARMLGDICRRVHGGSRAFSTAIIILGPIAAPVPKISKQYRWQILLKGKTAETLHRFVHQTQSESRAAHVNRRVKIVVDVDPVHMM